MEASKEQFREATTSKKIGGNSRVAAAAVAASTARMTPLLRVFF
jgi:hypothetical protein